MRIRRLTPAHADAYRRFMLRAYAREPGFFTVTVEERAELPRAFWRARVAEEEDAPEQVFAAVAGARIAGVAGLRRATHARTRHRVELFGLVVSPAFRRRGVGRTLVGHVLDAAARMDGVRVVHLRVVAENATARRLYEAAGFTPFGVEPLALRTADGFSDVIHLWRAVGGEEG